MLTEQQAQPRDHDVPRTGIGRVGQEGMATCRDGRFTADVV